MKKKIINSLIKIIKNQYNYDDTKILEIKYGLESLYLTITKGIVIFILALLINVEKELLYLLLFYGIIRVFAFGAHAKTTLQCWILSIATFISIPILIKYVFIPKYILISISLVLLILICKYAPADTEKRVLINKKKRYILKLLSILTTLIYIFIMIYFANLYWCNILFYSILTETILILPITYKVLGLKYNNYLLYKKGGKK